MNKTQKEAVTEIITRLEAVYDQGELDEEDPDCDTELINALGIARKMLGEEKFEWIIP